MVAVLGLRRVSVFVCPLPTPCVQNDGAWVDKDAVGAINGLTRQCNAV